MKTTLPPHSTPWVCRAAFPLLSACFFATQGLLAFSVLSGWWIAAALLLLVVSHLMHGMLIAFHEAAHGNLRRSRLLNEIDGILIGYFSLTSFALYRALHQKHHVHLATIRDVELWPFVDPRQPRWWRRTAAFLELNFGLFYTPYLFWRVFFRKGSPVSNPQVRRRVWLELWGGVLFWGLILAGTAALNLWLLLLVNYLLPAFIAGNLQSWRKYIEHVGLSGNSARSATRSIVAEGWPGRLVSLTLLHEPLHGIHHLKGSLLHSELPARTAWLAPEEPGDTVPFPSYRSAFLDLVKRLPDPRVGSQWETVPPAPAKSPVP